MDRGPPVEAAANVGRRPGLARQVDQERELDAPGVRAERRRQTPGSCTGRWTGRQAAERTARSRATRARFVFRSGSEDDLRRTRRRSARPWRDRRRCCCRWCAAALLPVPDSASISASIAGRSSLLAAFDDRIGGTRLLDQQVMVGERPVDRGPMPKASQARAFSAERTSPRT